MSIAKLSELGATSNEGFQDAIELGIARADKTLRNVKSAWIKEQHVRVTQGAITESQVNMMVTFIIDDGPNRPGIWSVGGFVSRRSPAHAAARCGARGERDADPSGRPHPPCRVRKSRRAQGLTIPA